MGFSSVSSWAQSEGEGRSWVTFFRKVPASTATIANQWFDYSTASGVPVPNYYASSPLAAATLESDKGIWIPSPGSEHYLKRSIVMSGASAVTSKTNQNQVLILADYLLYYPFIDLDAVGEEQIMDNTTELPRYESGVGVMAMMVAQSPTVGGGSFSFKYIGTDDVEYTSTTINCAAAQPSGALVQSISGTTGLTPYLPISATVSGIKRIVSVTVSVANGGLAAIVLVKPLQTSYCREECRRPTSSPTESFGDASEIESVRQGSGAPRIYDGAFLGWVGRGAGGSLASSKLVGILETFWT